MSGRRVVLLARAGGARERTEAALKQADAELLATFDPATVEADQIRAGNPEVLLVVLDPVVESLLDGFADLFGDPDVDVMFDDAEIAARREGWEEARWIRHLHAKLHGHDDVLPRVGGREPPSTFVDMEHLSREVAAMPDLPQAGNGGKGQVAGAVVIFAGVGGPDAVRQVLGSLPAQFPRAVLLQQRIEGGQYAKLVRQMGRAAAMPVMLAEPGDPIEAGRVYVMAEGIGVRAGSERMVFANDDGTPPFAALRAADSAAILLSGADMTHVDVAVGMRWAGGLALGQSPHNCFDATASNALVARGGEAKQLADISRQLTERWPA